MNISAYQHIYKEYTRCGLTFYIKYRHRFIQYMNYNLVGFPKQSTKQATLIKHRRDMPSCKVQVEIYIDTNIPRLKTFSNAFKDFIFKV